MLKRAEKIAEYFKDDDSIRLYKYSSQDNDVDIPEISVGLFHKEVRIRQKCSIQSSTSVREKSQK